MDWCNQYWDPATLVTSNTIVQHDIEVLRHQRLLIAWGPVNT